MFVVEQPIPPTPATDFAENVLAEWNALYDAYNEVACLMLSSMTPELHRQFENYSSCEMIQELRSMFEKQARVERFDLIQTFYACKQEEDFARFMRNNNMHNMGKTIGELHSMLIKHEKDLPKKAETPQVMLIKGGKIHKYNNKSLKAKGKGKANGKGKDKQVYIPKPKNPKPAAKEHPPKDDTYHHCKEVGHWKRKCLVYFVELLKKKQVGIASSSGIFTIELFAFPNKSWVYDTGCGAHICITKHRFREARKLKQGLLYLYVGNGVRAQVEAIRSFDLVLPNGLVICLDNCYYEPSVTRGVVSVNCLVEKGFVQCFTDFGISVFKNNVFYFNAIPSNGIYEIDMHDLVPNVNFIYNVSTKRAKHNLDSTYLWYCRLAHIRKSFLHHPERATSLLGIIHTDVYGPLRHVSRQGASYFFTFTDDYSRYGYVYILKHKHEVFEMFKVFKNEVENQLEKTIKALRSDRGGEYINQEFKDYLKAYGIIQQLTPPYTPQHKGVFERRNHTLLDMVRSMMNLTTLSLSFWDYALESTTRILNMVPTKNVDKTPYELWYAEFFKKNLITQKVSRRAIDLEETQDEDTSPSEIISKIPMRVEGFEPPQEEVISIRRSERTHRASNRLCLNVEVEEHSPGDLNEPTSNKATILDSESNKWIDAMNAEIQSMMDNMVWVLVDLPPGCKTVGKTFSLVADIIRILISITAFYDYEIWQMDVKTAFLNGYLDEYIYMVQPEGFVDPNHPKKVCKLQRFIYGIKQASRSWNKIFNEEIKRFGSAQNLDEPCVYQKASGSNVIFLILYVDDIIIMGNYILSLQSVKDYLGKCFAMKDLGEAAFILGIKIYRDRTKRLIKLD
nr:hypothetical protein [Tanacetum cinerariifolium]